MIRVSSPRKRRKVQHPEDALQESKGQGLSALGSKSAACLGPETAALPNRKEKQDDAKLKAASKRLDAYRAHKWSLPALGDCTRSQFPTSEKDEPRSSAKELGYNESRG